MVIVVKRPIGKRPVGKTWGLSVTETLKKIFRENEKKLHWTDNEITEFLIKEFGVDRMMYHQISMLRWNYNHGGYTRDSATGNWVPPAKQSKRYGRFQRSNWRNRFSPRKKIVVVRK